MKYFWLILLIGFGLNAQTNLQTSAQNRTQIRTQTSAQTSAQASAGQIKLGQEGIDHQLWDHLLKRHVSDQGRVDYSSFQGDISDLNRYISALSKEAEGIKIRSKEEQLAFWINAYNACTVKLICDNLPLSSIKDLSRPWKQTVLKSKNNAWTLDDIEHEILRKFEEPRIHFAINCASKSCPILSNEAYRGDQIDRQLNRAASVFFNDSPKNNYTEKRLNLSRIFLWFKRDFGPIEDLIQLINQYTKHNFAPNVAISYLSYDWSLNN
jgi:hypothetical protein